MFVMIAIVCNSNDNIVEGTDNNRDKCGIMFVPVT